MIQELSEKIWSNPKFQVAWTALELAWLQKLLSVPDALELESHLGGKALQAAAILATSNKEEHRKAAYRVATCAFDLFGNSSQPLDQALRVVLTRLGNFPAIGTNEFVNSALTRLPLSLATDELNLVSGRTVELHGRDLVLTNFQFELWEHLAGGRRVAISAPTSAGKSFVLQAFLTSLFENADSCKTVVYLVPTRALITQVANDLTTEFKNVKAESIPEIITVPVDGETLPVRRAVYVLTQERAQLCLAASSDFKADLIIVDEAHSIAEGARGILLQWIVDDLLKRNSGTQILFASPLIRNLSIFGRVFGLDHVAEFPSVEPTVSQNFVAVKVFSGAKGLISLASLGDGKSEAEEIGTISIGHTLAGRADKLVHISARLGRGQSNIIYANGAAESELIAIQLAELFEGREPTTRQLELAELAKEAVHEKFVLASCLERGVAFHYSQIPTLLRGVIEQAVSVGDVDHLVCTSTLLQGVNLPAKNIFMFAPEKGRGHPLASTDFWNLSGRAGRLRREFQGNIFLIDYEKWKEQPLDGPKDAVITPAIEACVIENSERLVEVIADDVGRPSRKDQASYESTFSRLYSDYHRGELISTFSRMGIASDAPSAQKITEALKEASATITLPHDIIRRTPSISAHRQQKLFETIEALLEVGARSAAERLIPAHPRESEAFDSYAYILELCHSRLQGIDTARNLHRFHALLAVRWMKGIPLPQIIEEQIRRKPNDDVRKVIRETLELIEKEIRFRSVNLFSCYISILAHAFARAGLQDYVERLLPLALFLEIGASDKSMISFISLGLSRLTAMKLNDIAARKDMDIDQARIWLKSRRLGELGLSNLLQDEVLRVLGI
ncbi:DEAD/DEAH box helicase [Rhizobium sp. UPM1132]|uniref:DEAD/DEAH box helicase n=1 Tax=Rhizobium ruizarguesonis TaxID=2081791 RepID=UPI001447877E|nr:DEAD/DEAH box helicase [Rhizobium ruizarguesonis]NKQ69714.1 DEAD/DEAH box helicase [Rhizobium ruizarguesonis]